LLHTGFKRTFNYIYLITHLYFFVTFLCLNSRPLPRIPEHRIYTESFFGGGAVLFAKSPAEAEIINDTNSLAITFYEVLKTDFNTLKAKTEATLFSRATYTVALTIFKIPHLFNKLQQAWAFYIATNMGFDRRGHSISLPIWVLPVVPSPGDMISIPNG